MALPNPFAALEKTRKGLSRNRPGSHNAPIQHHDRYKVGVRPVARTFIQHNHPPMMGGGKR